MRFTVKREPLLKALNVVSRAVPQKAEVPALCNIKIVCSEKGIELIGSDKSLTIRSIVPYMIGEEEIVKNVHHGATLVNSSLIVNTIKYAKSEFIDFELIDRSILKITSGDSVYKPITSKAEDYPDLDLEQPENAFDVKCSEFARLVDSVAFAASNKDTRPILMCVNLSAGNGTLTAVATDTARLARKRIMIDSTSTFSINILSRRLLEIVRAFENEEYVTFSCNAQKAVFVFGNTLITTTLSNGDYPSTDRVMPKNFNYYLEVNSKEFIEFLEQQAVYDQHIKMTMSEGEVTLLSRSQTAGSATTPISTFQFSGEQIEVSFKAQFVMEAIKALNCEDVTFAMVGEMKPFVIRNVKDDSVDMLITALVR